MTILIQIAVAIVLALIAYALAPKPKVPKPDTSQELEAPTAEAGRPIPVAFGTVTIQSPNCLYSGDAQTVIVKVKA